MQTFRVQKLHYITFASKNLGQNLVKKINGSPDEQKVQNQNEVMNATIFLRFLKRRWLGVELRNSLSRGLISTSGRIHFKR